jgi:hypothetical protein
MDKPKIVMRPSVFLAISTIGLATLVAPSIAVRARPQPKTDTREGVLPAGPQRTFANASGWQWLESPRELHIGRKFGHVSENLMLICFSAIEPGNGALQIFLVEIGPDVHNKQPPRVVILNAAGERYLPKVERDTGMLANRDTQMFNAIFTLSPETLAPTKAAYVGVEESTRPRGDNVNRR